MLIIAQAESDKQIDAARHLLREFTTWALTIDSDKSKDAPTFRNLETELATLPGIYAPPQGRLLLATYDGQPAGCVCLKAHDAATCELKRLYVRPAFRGHDIGWGLVNQLIDEARVAGYKRMILDSHISMEKAHAIYEGAGFRRVSAWPDFPEHLKPLVVFMERDLT